MTVNPKLLEAWKQRSKKIAEGNKFHAVGRRLYAEGNSVYTEGNRVYAEAHRLYAKGDKLCAKGSKLFAEGNFLWANAVIEVHGKNITMEWKQRQDVEDYDCVLGSEEVYTVEMARN